MKNDLRQTIYRRSSGRCEAWVTYELYGTKQMHRCNNAGTEIHHLLTKGRGGANLDKVGETYHLIHLCRGCHAASDGGDAYIQDMLIEGRVEWDRLLDKPVYSGPDPYLTKEYS